MTQYHKCKDLEVTIKDMSRGALFILRCKRDDSNPSARHCSRCTYKEEHRHE